MKVVVVERPVKDVDGVLVALRSEKPPLDVITVGTDDQHTYIYLADRETRSPKSKVLEWKDKPELRLTFDSPLRIPADGKSTARITVTHCDPLTGVPVNARVKVDVSSRRRLPVSKSRISMKDGQFSITIGPSNVIGDDVVEVTDPSWVLKTVQARFTFIEVPPPPPPPASAVSKLPTVVKGKPVSDKKKAAQDENEKRPSVWTVFRKIIPSFKRSKGKAE